jgi:hypothetical protein
MKMTEDRQTVVGKSGDKKWRRKVEKNSGDEM